MGNISSLINVKKIIKAIFFFFIFNGCVVSFVKSWMEDNVLHTLIKNNNNIPLIDIRLHRDVSIIPTIPIMFQTQSKKYGLEIYLSIDNLIYKTLDSLHYILIDSTANCSINGKFVINKPIEKHVFDDRVVYKLEYISPYTINFLPGRHNTIKGNLWFYFTDTSNVSKTFNTDFFKFYYWGHSGIYGINN